MSSLLHVFASHCLYFLLIFVLLTDLIDSRAYFTGFCLLTVCCLLSVTHVLWLNGKSYRKKLSEQANRVVRPPRCGADSDPLYSLQPYTQFTR